ncbi:MAG TPA: hypothetical protein VKB86_16920 [Pyrinomonadaceae bacterium]|nr:hypothetical protein [Pyrinomonadaceae bacterium]
MCRKKRIKHVVIAALMLFPVLVQAKTPKLNITLKHGTPLEQQRKEQIERLAAEYDLEKYTITRDIIIEQGGVNHSAPVLTQNIRFLDNDDRALSAYVHEQGHWVLMERHRGEVREMLQDLKRMYPDLPIAVPQGDGNEGTSYIHLVVIMLEWQALENLIGPERAKAVLDFKRQDHYTALYSTVMENRSQMEKFLKHYGVKW